ncbi:aromatic-ring-hydroxylating dioxygenase subunit beta [Thiobacillus thioparus]|uniref:aromatic-ring-hydroxylating dioxygenase subunit beta n=1 Tax=Thiobacillus thioparus TaxID=931 RepID=UPI00059312F9|nr:aromatic-ring-hydroxylating dioxygenase subunit beta [Thiobacillus thioparus]
MTPKQLIDELIYRSSLAMDSKNFTGFLDLCDPAFRYAITAYIPEIRKEMTWLEHDKDGMKVLFDNLPRHNSDHSSLSRHVTVYTVEQDEAKQQAKTVSALQVFKTSLDGGATELFAVGKVYDTISMNGGNPKLLDRNVRLDTRMLGIGYHIPL